MINSVAFSPLELQPISKKPEFNKGKRKRKTTVKTHKKKSTKKLTSVEEESESNSLSSTRYGSYSGVRIIRDTDPTSLLSNVVQIGTGLTSNVYLANYKDREVAVKEMKLTKKQRKFILDEIKIMHQLHSRYLVKMISAHIHNGTSWILMQYMDAGSLGDILRYVQCNELQVAYIIRKVLHGLKRMHDKNFIHRDLKCGNIFLSKTGSIKIGDFGFSTQIDALKEEGEADYIVGSPYWMAPEISDGLSYSFASDIWAIGIMCIEMINGSPPYSQIPPKKAIKHIKKYGIPKLRGFSPEYRDFVERCTRLDPKDRPSAKELLEHNFLKTKCDKKSIVDFIQNGLKAADDADLFGF
ncbi:STE family protein kinase [Histomonas meleagridis]|uniref:STE family protein kinase n=1 Tax=Histomonas meleagridis TaxID=135588 RepID=UPI003559D429|nr:STE family protein kinase [Histomonas meleagridis]KAH0799701.1 STE family protein kinase [Histomonas meleagridis]